MTATRWCGAWTPGRCCGPWTQRATASPSARTPRSSRLVASTVPRESAHVPCVRPCHRRHGGPLACLRRGLRRAALGGRARARGGSRGLQPGRGTPRDCKLRRHREGNPSDRGLFTNSAPCKAAFTPLSTKTRRHNNNNNDNNNDKNQHHILKRFLEPFHFFLGGDF